MTDDTENVTSLPNNGNGKKPKKAKDILAEILGEEKAEAAKLFKQSLKEKRKEVLKLKEVSDAGQAELDKLMTEFDDANT